MSDVIGGGEPPPVEDAGRRLVPMPIGTAVVYVEQVGPPTPVAGDDSIYPVGPPSPHEMFANAVEVLQECVRVVGERVGDLAAQTMPQEVTVEFTLTFEAKGKTALIPVFVTGETGAATGLKVTAVWRRSGRGG